MTGTLGKKGAFSALRDAQFFKTVYPFELPRREACMLDLADLRSNPNNSEWAVTAASMSGTPVARLVEYGYPERFVQEQVGHSYASSTAIYTDVSDDYKTGSSPKPWPGSATPNSKACSDEQRLRDQMEHPPANGR